MSVVENIFVATDLAPREVVDGWLVPLLDLELLPEAAGAEDEIGLRNRDASAEEWLVVVVSRNSYAGTEPEDEVQAFDSYPIEIAIRRFPKSETAQREKAREIFEKLVAARPDLPMMLVHDLGLMVAAHLPGAGTHDFPGSVSVDAPDQDKWRPWVLAPDGR